MLITGRQLRKEASSLNFKPSRQFIVYYIVALLVAYAEVAVVAICIIALEFALGFTVSVDCLLPPPNPLLRLVSYGMVLVSGSWVIWHQAAVDWCKQNILKNQEK